MLLSLALALSLAVQSPCPPGQVIGVDQSRDYTITLCGGTVIGLRGVEPPLRNAVSDGNDPAHQHGGDILGGKDISPESLPYLASLLIGKRVNIVPDGYRIGDLQGRTYAYVYLDKQFVNAELIRRGYGYAERQGQHPMRAQFFALEEIAHRAKVGVWSQ